MWHWKEFFVGFLNTLRVGRQKIPRTITKRLNSYLWQNGTRKLTHQVICIRSLKATCEQRDAMNLLTRSNSVVVPASKPSNSWSIKCMLSFSEISFLTLFYCILGCVLTQQARRILPTRLRYRAYRDQWNWYHAKATRDIISPPPHRIPTIYEILMWCIGFWVQLLPCSRS